MIEEQTFYWKLLDTLKDGVYFANKKRIITYWNKAAEAITGYRRTEMLGKSCSDNKLSHIDENGCNLCVGTCPLSGTIDTGQAVESKIYLHHKDGHRIPVLVRTTPVYNKNEEIIGAVEIFSDLSAHDPLEKIHSLENPELLSNITGLPSRQYLEMNIKMKLFEWNEFHHPFGIFYLKVIGLEEAESLYGKDAVEGITKTLSKTLLHNIKPNETIGEWGNGEFLCIVGAAANGQLSSSADSYLRLLEKSGLSVNGTPVTVSFSVGTAVVQEGDSMESLLERAGKTADT